MADGSVSEEPVLNATVSVGSPVSEKRPVTAHFFDPPDVDVCEHERLVLGGFGDHHAERVADERVSPEFDPGTFPTQPLEADAIHRGDPAAVRNRMTALDRLPGVELLLAVLLFLRGVPADRGRIEQNVGPLQRSEP